MAVTTADSLLRVAEAIHDNDGIALDQPSIINPVTGLYGDTRKLTGAVLMEQISLNSVVKAMVDDKVLQETSRALEKEAELNNAIIAENSRAVQQEADLSGRITNEENRATEQEGELFDAINAEKDRAVTAEGNLLRLIGDEQLRASTVEGELRADLTEETARALTAEQSAQTTGNEALMLAQSNKQEIDSIHGMTARLDATSFPFVAFSDDPDEYAIQQQLLTDYALSQLHFENVERIPNFIGVHNINGSHLFIFNAAQTEPSVIPAYWVDDGIDTVSIADENNAGIVKGGGNVDIASNGMMSVDLSGLREKNADVVLLDGEKIKGIDKDGASHDALMVKTTDTAKTQGTIIADIQETVNAINQVAIDLSTGIMAAVAGIEHITGLTLAGSVNAIDTIHITIAYTGVNGAVVAYEQDGTGDFYVDLSATLAVMPPGAVITLANNGALDGIAQISNLIFTTYFFERKVQTELGKTDTHTEISSSDRPSANGKPLAYTEDIAWGNIVGTLTEQADLQVALAAMGDAYTYQSWDVVKPLNRVEENDIISGMRLYLTGKPKTPQNASGDILTDTFTLLRFTGTDSIENGDGEVIYDGSDWLVEYIDIPADAGAITDMNLGDVSLMDVLPSSIELKQLVTHTVSVESLATNKLDTGSNHKNGVTETRALGNITSGHRMSDENDGTVSFSGFVTDPDDPIKQKVITTETASGNSTGILIDKDKAYYITRKNEAQKTPNDEIVTKEFVLNNSQNVVRYMGQCDTQNDLPTTQLRGGDQYRILDLGASYNNHAGWATWSEIDDLWDIVEDKQNVPDGVSLGYNSVTGASEIKDKGVSVAKIADSSGAWQFLTSDSNKGPVWVTPDEQPIQSSRKPVTSGTVYTELAKKANLYDSTGIEWKLFRTGISLTAGFNVSDKRVYYNFDNIDFSGASCGITFNYGGLTRELRYNSTNKNVSWGTTLLVINGTYSQPLGYIDLAADLGASPGGVITVLSVNNTALLDWCDVWSLQSTLVKRDVGDAYELAKAAMNAINAGSPGGWGSITGDINNQADLKSKFDVKANRFIYNQSGIISQYRHPLIGGKLIQILLSPLAVSQNWSDGSIEFSDGYTLEVNGTAQSIVYKQGADIAESLYENGAWNISSVFVLPENGNTVLSANLNDVLLNLSGVFRKNIDLQDVWQAALNVVVPSDSGWQILSLAADFSGSVKYRKIGNRISVWLDIIPENATTNTLGTLPVEYRPAVGEIRFIFGKVGDDTDNLIPIRGGIGIDGSISITGNTERSGINMLGYTEYYAD